MELPEIPNLLLRIVSGVAVVMFLLAVIARLWHDR